MRTGAIVLVLVGCGGDAGARGSTTSETEAAATAGSVASSDGTDPVETTSGAAATSGTTSGGDTEASTSGPQPDVGEGFDPLRVVVLSDLNGSYGSTTYDTLVHDAADTVVTMGPDLVLGTGDMVAGQQAGLDYPAMWAGFHAAVSDVLAGADIPFAVSPGNHDASGYPAFAEEREEFVAQWIPRKPTLSYIDDADYPLRYAFTAGPALFVSLDSTTIGALSDEQMTWLDGVLTEGAEMPAKIVYGHVPLWAVAQGRETELIGDPALEELLVAHDVTLFIGGHHHAYYPGRHGGLHHVVTACLGSGPRALVGDTETAPRALLYLELDEAGTLTALDALTGAALDTPIDRTTLPPSITIDDVTLERDDGV